MKRIAPLLLLIAAAIFFVANSQIISEKISPEQEGESSNVKADSAQLKVVV
jgi:hypothetical protein